MHIIIARPIKRMGYGVIIRKKVRAIVSTRGRDPKGCEKNTNYIQCDIGKTISVLNTPILTSSEGGGPMVFIDDVRIKK